MSAFSLSRRLAVGYDHDWRRFGVHSMFFTRDPNNDAGKYGWALRVFTKPIRGSDKIAHFQSVTRFRLRFFAPTAAQAARSASLHSVGDTPRKIAPGG